MRSPAPGQRPVAWLTLGCLLAMPPAVPVAAAAQPGDLVVADANIRAVDRVEAEQERLRAMIQGAPAAYEDNYLSADGGQMDGQPEGDTQPELPGLRSWSLETRAGFGQSNTNLYGRQHAAEFGIRAEYRQETLNYGDMQLQLDARHMSGNPLVDVGGIGSLGFAHESTSDRFTFRNLGFPITPSTFADSAVGDIYSELTDGLSRNYRLSLGTSNVRGLSTRIFNSEYDVRAGTGQRGYLAGGPYPGFEKSQGAMSWLGATRRLNDEWFVAGQLDRATEVPGYFTSILNPDGFGSKDVSSWATSVGYAPKSVLADGSFKLRTTLVGSNVTSTTPGVQTGASQGVFVESSIRHGRFNHEVGAYVADPNLHFGDYSLATGTRGAYWRVDHSANRLGWGAGVDYEKADSDGLFNLYGYTRAGVNGNFQYILDRDSSVGASLNVYQTRYDNAIVASLASESRSVYGNAFYQTRFFDFPRSRLSLTVQRNEQIVLFGTAATGQEVQWEQDWITGRYETLRPELTTTLGYARDESGGSIRHYPTAGVQFRYWLDSGFSFTGNLRYTSQDGDLYTSRGLSGALTAEKQVAPGWRIGAAVNLNQARSAAIQTPLFGPSVYRSNDKTFYFFLRYDGSTGTSYQTLGARSGAGAGSISGRVYFDANRDGQLQVGENGAANVEVVLDGRYRVTTDRDGRFEFPMASTGRHQLTLTLDSVPLPWGAASESGVSVNVPLRGQANAEIPVIKVGE